MLQYTKNKARLINAIILALTLSLLFFSNAYGDNLKNQLKNHPSPYLAMHGDDPVQWQDWNKNIVEQAIKENKLIFISSGYFSCHWCHVMQRESFSDKTVAAQLHKLAIPVKIDRELQPALDAWLIEFTQRTTGQAGWPLNVFLTPDGYPLVGLTYLPQEQFVELLNSLQQRWKNDEAYLRKFALNAFDLIKPKKQLHAGFKTDKYTQGQLTNLLTQHALQIGDDIAGGFGEQNKFPMSPQLLALLEIQEQQPDKHLADLLKLTLDQMANLGLRDHIGGGFYRYVVDPGWEIPHFEKMLYDNAQLALVYLRAASLFNEPDYQTVATSTLDFVLNAMHHNDAYVASLSAVDDQGIEGGYYLWSNDELKALLTAEELAIVEVVWGTQATSTLEEGHHLKIVTPLAQVAKQLASTIVEIEKHLASATNKLRHARTKRNIPVDTKILASWNGLLLKSLSEAVQQVDDNSTKKRYKQAASKLFDYLSNNLWDGKQLHRFTHQGKTGGKVSLEDYAYVADGMLAWASVTNDSKVWNTTLKIAEAALNRFHNENGWQLSEQLPIPYNARELVLPDHTMPSPSAVLLKTLLAISAHNKDEKLSKRVTALVDTDTEGLTTSPLWNATHIALILNILEQEKISIQR